MIIQTIKSRPTYPGLQINPHAKANLIAVDADGREGIAELSERIDDAVIERTTILLSTAGLQEEDPAAALGKMKAANVWTFPTNETLLARLDIALSKARMGTQLYAVGNEPLLAEVVQLGMKHGIPHPAIGTEHRGSLRRRVQCVHCKGITENVTTNPVTCSHCGLNLLVRDHYSRRIGAFQGVCIDAEAPGEAPEQKVEFA